MSDNNDLDRRLSDYAERWRAQQPAPPAPEVPMRNRLPHWLPAVAAAAAVVLIAGGTAYAVTNLNDDNAGTPTVQPSITPVDLTGAVPWTDAAPDNSLQPCTPTTIAGAAGRVEAAAGTGYYNFTLTNTGAAACSLPTDISMTLHADGLSDVTVPPDTSQHAARLLTLRPGGIATVPLAVPTLCEGANPGGGAQAQTYTDVAVILGDTGTETVPGQQISYFGCAPFVAPYTVDNSSATQGGNAAADLDVALELPSGVVAGTTLVYVVNLTNATQHTIDLSGACPAYTQRLFDTASNTVADGTYALNCDGAGNTIAPGAMTRFEMHLDVPSGTLAGSHILNWYFRGLDKPGTKSSVDVVAP